MPCPLHPEPESAPPACTCRATEETPEQGRARRAARMRRLAELGMRLAEKLADEVEAGLAVSPAAPEDATREDATREDATTEDATRRFARIARVVHQLTALEERLSRPPEAVATPAPPPPESTSTLPPEIEKPAATFDIVHALIAEERTPRAAEAATEAINAEIEAGYDCIDLIHRPLGEIVAEVARVFVLNPDWSPWAGEPWVPDAVRRWEALMAEDAEADGASP